MFIIQNISELVSKYKNKRFIKYIFSNASHYVSTIVVSTDNSWRKESNMK